jgi:hypothetical protein
MRSIVRIQAGVGRLCFGWQVVAVGAFGLFGAACGPSVTIHATSAAARTASIEPVSFIVFESNTGPEYTEPLQRALNDEMSRRRIAGKAHILPYGELDEDAALRKHAQGMRGVVWIIPTGGSSYYGSLKQIKYDVQAYSLEGPTGAAMRRVWRSKVDTSSGSFGFQINARLEQFAQDLVERLIQDGVIRAR